MREKVLYPEIEDKGTRIDVFLSAALSETRSRIKTLVERGKVLIDGDVVTKSGQILKGGETVVVTIDDPVRLSTQPENIPLNIVYEDDSLAVINKAQGMVTHPAAGSPDGTLVNALLFHIKDLSAINGVYRPGIVHRLDKDTSGLMVVAKTNQAHLSLAKQISEKTAERYYYGLVCGNVKEDDGTVDAPLERCRNERLRITVSSGGKRAVTHYTVLERFKEYTFMEFKLETGRTHQIRAHMKYKNHPIACDVLYGGRTEFPESNGQLLHSHRLSFTHPITGERLTFDAPLPDYFENVLQKLRKRNG